MVTADAEVSVTVRVVESVAIAQVVMAAGGVSIESPNSKDVVVVAEVVVVMVAVTASSLMVMMCRETVVTFSMEAAADSAGRRAGTCS